MMGIVGDLLSGKLRKEMKERVDQVLKASEEWSRTAKELIDAMNRLSEAIRSGGIDNYDFSGVEKGLRSLARSTTSLRRSLDKHSRTLSKIMSRM